MLFFPSLSFLASFSVLFLVRLHRNINHLLKNIEHVHLYFLCTQLDIGPEAVDILLVGFAKGTGSKPLSPFSSMQDFSKFERKVSEKHQLVFVVGVDCRNYLQSLCVKRSSFSSLHSCIYVIDRLVSGRKASVLFLRMCRFLICPALVDVDFFSVMILTRNRADAENQLLCVPPDRP